MTRLTLTRPPVIPEGWCPNPTDKQFNDWIRYISGKRVYKTRAPKQQPLRWFKNHLRAV